MTSIYGKVVEIREFKWGSFVVLEVFGDPWICIQCVLSNDLMVGLKVNSWATMKGEMKPANVKRSNTVPDRELHVAVVEVLSSPTVDLPITINEPEPTFSLNNALDHRGLSIQTDSYKSVFKAQDCIEHIFTRFLHTYKFMSIHTPKIVAEGAEGGTDVFSLDYFGRTAYLAQSPQFYKQICCAAFGRVYEVAPVFRAEKHNTSRHLNEYISMDVELVLDPTIALSSLDQLMELERLFLMELAVAFPNLSVPDALDIISIPFSKAKEILGTDGHDMSSTEEQELGRWAKEKHGSDALFIHHYHRDVRPFYTKISEDGIHTESFDCILKGIEITSGGQRANDHQEYIDAMEKKGLDPNQFSFYLDNFKYGFPIHGGFAIGLERLTAKLCDLPSVKMASLFPRDVDRLTP